MSLNGTEAGMKIFRDYEDNNTYCPSFPTFHGELGKKKKNRVIQVEKLK